MRSSAPCRQWIAIIASILAVGCGGDDPPAAPPATVDLSGTWVGTVVDDKNGTGTGTFVLTQTGNTISGTSSLAATDGVVPGTGTIEGTISGTAFTMSFRTSFVGGLCVAIGGGSWNVTGTSMQGSYTAVNNCSGNHIGQVTLQKQ